MADVPKKDAQEPIVLPADLPVVALKGLVMFPKITVPLLLSDARAAAAVSAAASSDRLAVFVAAKDDDVKDPGAGDLHEIGTVCRITESVPQPDGATRLLIEGIERVRITKFVQETPYLRAKAQLLPQPHEDKSEAVEALMYSVVNQFKDAVGNGAPVPFDVLLVVMNLNDPWQLADIVALNMDFRTQEK